MEFGEVGGRGLTAEEAGEVAKGHVVKRLNMLGQERDFILHCVELLKNFNEGGTMNREFNTM